VVLYERGARAAAFDLQAMAGVFGLRVCVCGGNEGDNKVLEGSEELMRLLVFGKE
jgi:hypothetical protein